MQLITNCQRFIVEVEWPADR